MKRIIFLLLLLLNTQLWSEGGVNVVTSGALFDEDARTVRSGISLQPIYLENEVDSNYIVGPGDFFDLFFEDHNITIQVSPDSKIVIEEAGIIDVSNKTLAQTKREILELAAQKYDQQHCYVYLSRTKSFRVGIYGAVRVPGQHAVPYGIRLSTLLNVVSGTLSYANDREVKIIRKEDTLSFNLHRAEYYGESEHDPYIEQGDKVYVPFIDMTAPRINVQWKTAKGIQSIYLEWEKDKPILEYIKSSGALRADAEAFVDVKIANFENTESVSIPFSMAGQTIPDSNKVIDLTARKSYVYVGGATAAPGRVEFDPNYAPIDYIAGAGVLTISAKLKKVKVIRADGSTEIIHVTSGKVYPGDFIKLPKSRYERTKDFIIFITSALGIVSTALALSIAIKDRQ